MILTTSPIESSCTLQSGSTSGTSTVNWRLSPISEFLVLRPYLGSIFLKYLSLYEDCGRGVMSGALKRKMVTIFVIFVVMLLFNLCDILFHHDVSG